MATLRVTPHLALILQGNPFDRACAHVEQRLSEAASRPHDTSDCARASACICFSPRAHDLCSYRIARPEGGKL